MASRVMVFGLDCASPDWLLARWLDDLPTLANLVKRGYAGVLRSCNPPITVPAWSVMASSRNPGALGIYGFRNRADHSYDRMRLANSQAVQVPRVWDVLSRAGRNVIVLGVPGTWPVSHVNGAMVSCFLTPDVQRFRYTHPPTLAKEIETLVGRYMPDVTNFRVNDKARLLAEIEEMTDRRFKLAEHLLSTRPWDLFFMVEMGTDRMHHGFWRHSDPGHRLYEPGNRWSSAMLDYYKRLDERIGHLLRFASEDTAVLVVSDHGAKRMDGGICINEWLRREGFLALVSNPPEPTPLRPDMVDWRRTVAWGEGGYYGRLFVNVRGREPSGVVPTGEYEAVRNELKERLEALGDESGHPIGTVAFRPEDLYPQIEGIPPDLLVYFGDLHWRSIGRVGTSKIHVFENDTGPDDANHAMEGLYILVTPEVTMAERGQRDIRDVAPTILHLLGEPVPNDMEGVSMVATESRPVDSAERAGLVG